MQTSSTMSEQQSGPGIQWQSQLDQSMSSQDAFTRPNPIDIPELLQLIASYMRKRDIVSCLCVSRLWYRAFLPDQWAELEIILSRDKCVGPPLSEREKYWPLVRKIAIDFEGNFKMPCSAIKCRNLTHLVVRDVRHQYNNLQRAPIRNGRSIVALIKRHQSSLKDFSSISDTKEPVLEALSGCPKLEKLRLRYRKYVFEKDWMKWYGRLWSRLESFYWEEYEPAIENENVVTEVMTEFSHVGPTTIKDLRLGDGHRLRTVKWTHVLLVMKSLELTRLQWDVHRDIITILAKIAQVTPFGQHLQHLVLWFANLKNKDLQMLSTKLSKLERFEVSYGFLDMETFRTLGIETPQFLKTLKVLKLGKSSEHTGELSHAIMTSIHGLEEFTTGYITDIDIKKGGDRWICTGLKKLSMSIILLEEGTQDMVLDLLASLENLLTLDLTMGVFDVFDDARFPFVPARGSMKSYGPKLTLGHGLDRLRTLRRLEVFKAPCSDFTRFTEAEAHWILEHWPRLRDLKGVSVDLAGYLVLGSRILA
ncbi:hypothetical protein EMPS_10779 [Entomortierella parvispora]|uniref:F-box domain-containing protein n=1 Tax=Entomortierella parvispora TaxID=205924 RepID=A0A9P3HKI2_9FUNG|nr:hypothetical protein EMPS_10779 [Entomortierella parvispora]